MIGKIKSRKDGYLLVEILISMFIFSVLVFVISVFLKRIVIVEKAKKNNQKMYEEMYFSMDKIVLDIKNRDIRKFSYEKKNNDILTCPLANTVKERHKARFKIMNRILISFPTQRKNYATYFNCKKSRYPRLSTCMA